MLNDEELDKLAGILYAAHEGCDVDSWEEYKQDCPVTANCWRRTAEAAVKSIVVVKSWGPE